MNKFTALSLLSVASPAVAVPMAGARMGYTGAYPTKAVVNHDINTVKGTAIGGAMSTPTAVPKALFAASGNTTTTTGAYPPDIVTITVINSYGGPITTSHSIASSVPTPVSGDVSTGTMSHGETASFAVPTGWIGNIAVNDAQYETTGDVSLIEANFVVPYEGTVAVVDVDISYVYVIETLTIDHGTWTLTCLLILGTVSRCQLSAHATTPWLRDATSIYSH